MRHLRSLFAMIVIIVVVLPTSAQLRFGVKAGIGVNSLKTTELDCVKDNSTGYSVGVMADFTVPIIGIGVDASVMYASRSTPKSVVFEAPQGNTVLVSPDMADKGYLEIPVNLKYALSIPVVSRIVKPFIATGPSVAINLSDKKDSAIEIKKTNVSWNLGAGVELISHLQIGFNYRWGLGTVAKTDLTWTDIHYNINTNGWQVSAAYLF